MNSNQTLSLRVSYKSCITRAPQRKRTDKYVVLSLEQYNKRTRSSSIFQRQKKKTRKKKKKKREKEIYQNVRYKSKLRLVTTVFDIASNGNGIPLHYLWKKGKKEHCNIRSNEFIIMKNILLLILMTVSWLDLPP